MLCQALPSISDAGNDKRGLGTWDNVIMKGKYRMERKVSVIIPAYNEEGSLEELHMQIVSGIKLMMQKGQADRYEIWFINDGSSDGTEQRMASLCKQDDNVHMISFRKNFGKSPALQAGFRHVTGDLVFTMDADLQDDPAEFTRFAEKIDEGYDLVVGWKQNRLDSAEKRLPSKLFNLVTSKASGIALHDFDCGFKCFRREVVDALDLYGELHRYVPVLAHRKGFSISEIIVNHRRREYGRSKYGAERYMRGLLDFLTTTFLLKYYDRPMYFFGRLGIISGEIGGVICIALTILKLFGQPIGGRPLLTLGVLLIIVGFQSVSTGVVCNLLIDQNFRRSYREDHIKLIK